ncbi:bifunctional diguanylate cyclase/phosphodiesterase [Steroidobacter sp. S1-65]|uniref:Bifunctional diguanylate cyclase/phosphodiesterase n=1 Tax=Steroidobacter gossypii TaxID=2805490 RepID=A0ABS1WYP5_9GAMM|nr:bifunctional diguanylate cyclase/phosphodiesterase [Steroidobacter gossypii]MBM0106099.1 bifunctional diguanylate cyclase/phosphodiesterase [Steroidobacter gossypii]
MKLSSFKHGSQWGLTLVVLAVVLLAGGRLIALSVNARAEQMRATAGTLVTTYSRSLERQLQTLAQQGSAGELDQVLSKLQLNRMVDAGYDFELSKVDGSGGAPRIFVSSKIEPLADAIISRIRLPQAYAQELSGGYVQLALRPKTGWYPARELAAAIALLAVVAWLLAFATHDLVHALHRARDALSLSRRQLQATNRKLAMEIEERQNLQQSFEHSRYHDAFTGLPNRRYFMDQLDRALREVRTRRRKRLAVMLINIDRFKLINDSLGHTAGDELVVQAARRFQKATAQLECVLARWSGDQFAVLVFDVASTDAALDIAGILQGELQQPFELRKHRLNAAARVGVTCIDSGLQRAEEAVREADIALSVAKRHDTATAVAYQPAMGGSAASLVSLEADLHVALQRRELHMMYQPIVDLRNRRVAGAESLLRWRHPIEGVLTPDKFIGLAEEVGLIVPITRWTIQQVCTLAAEWRHRLPRERDFYLTVNISAAALRDPEFTSFVARVLKDTGTPPEILKLELTEGGLMSNPGAARDILDDLHSLGVEMMLDDFGTGYSSLSYLQLFPFSYVKIDRPFVDRAGSAHANSAIAAAIVQMTSSLGLKSVAEIVETDAAANDLQRMGCDYAQGYFYYGALEAEEAFKVVRNADSSLPSVKQAVSAGESHDESPTISEAVVLSDETLMLPAEEVAEELRRKAEHE